MTLQSLLGIERPILVWVCSEHLAVITNVGFREGPASRVHYRRFPFDRRSFGDLPEGQCAAAARRRRPLTR